MNSEYDNQLEHTRNAIALLVKCNEQTDYAKKLASELSRLPKWRWLKRRLIIRRRDAALAEAQHCIMLYEA